MEFVKLGRTGLDVSRVCLGTMGFGGRGGPTHPWALSHEDSEPFFRTALEAGVNFFDTADHYNHGASEVTTGHWLRQMADREDVVVATKVGLSMGEGANRSGLSRKRIVRGLEASLKRLGMDYVDLLYIHRLDGETPDEEVLGAFDDLIRAGKVIYPAASSMPAWRFAELRCLQEAAGMQPFVAMQNLLNLTYREEEREMIPYCEERGVGVVPWSPIARGFLAGNKPREGGTTERARTDKSGGLFGRDEDYRILDRLIDVANEMGETPARVAYAWVMRHNGVTAPIVGATRIGQLEEALGALDLALEADVVRRLEEPYRPREVMGYSRPVR